MKHTWADSLVPFFDLFETFSLALHLSVPLPVFLLSPNSKPQSEIPMKMHCLHINWKYSQIEICISFSDLFDFPQIENLLNKLKFSTSKWNEENKQTKYNSHMNYFSKQSPSYSKDIILTCILWPYIVYSCQCLAWINGEGQFNWKANMIVGWNISLCQI